MQYKIPNIIPFVSPDIELRYFSLPLTHLQPSGRYIYHQVLHPKKKVYVIILGIHTAKWNYLLHRNKLSVSTTETRCVYCAV